MHTSPSRVVKEAVHAIRTLGEDLEPTVEASREAKLAYETLSQLSENWRRILLMHYVRGWGTGRIASLLEMDELAVVKDCSAALHAFLVAFRKCDKRKKTEPRKSTTGASSESAEACRTSNAAGTQATQADSSRSDSQSQSTYTSSQQCHTDDSFAHTRTKHTARATTRKRPNQATGASHIHTKESETIKIPASLLKGPLTKEKSFRLLKVSPTDPYEVRRKAYRSLIMQVHPDKFFSASPALKMRAENLSKRINLAWEMVGGA